MTPKPWIESVHLHPDVLKENAETDIFALDLGPLADGSGTVAVTVRAESRDGFDKSKLQNGVLEPLREADLVK